ncbi:hypothetical protein STEG23_014458, partial [Scotinomys teguina]
IFNPALLSCKRKVTQHDKTHYRVLLKRNRDSPVSDLETRGGERKKREGPGGLAFKASPSMCTQALVSILHMRSVYEVTLCASRNHVAIVPE